ncbi:MAG: FAD-dependent oxidoreductase [Archangiaceae bacterium]|nr:FAD-dependent oxidoreductase [Archangiaceae bacterium]
MRTRRYFLKTVMLGAAASSFPGCPPASAPARPTEPEAPHPLGKNLGSERFEPCHAVRDGGTWASAPVTATCDVAVIGGGPSGMTAAWRLRERDVMLLEKEPRLGGSCLLDEWQGVKMSTGGAFYTETETALVGLLKELGVEGTRVKGADSLVIGGQPVTDFFRDGADRLPFPQRVRDDFKRSRDEMLKLYRTRPKEELDAQRFSDLLKPYAPELTQFWNRFGPSNWGGGASETSGYVGAEAYSWAGDSEDPRRTFPGGLGGAAEALAAKLTPKLGSRVKTQVSVYRVETEGTGAKAKVVVRYLENGEPKALRAGAVILAVPKYFARHVLTGLDPARAELLKATRYAPYPVFNVCLKSAGPEPAYDNWFLDEPFTDFISADWIVHAGRGPAERKTALTVYHPLPEAQRVLLLADEAVLAMADGVAAGLEKHFPGTLEKIEEIRIFRRGHPMFIPTPGHLKVVERVAAPVGPVFFAHSDSSYFPAFVSAVEAAETAVGQASKRLGFSR